MTNKAVYHPCGCMEYAGRSWAMCAKHYANGRGPVEHLVSPPSKPAAFAVPRPEGAN